MQVTISALALACVAVVAGCTGQAGTNSSRAAQAAQAELARLDTRTPYPMTASKTWDHKQKMMGFSAAIARSLQAAANDDWEGVATASSPLGTKPRQEANCDNVWGVETGIDAMALDFRCRANKIAEAADTADHRAVLRATSETLNACNTCHAAFRSELQ
ncbi:MAG: cytochrome c [Nannocystaceae bacterium]|nr:cytochrome c [Nannocystaceae bacterium]